jgi:2,4-dienoyl-CoA reductase-like NADH-dependent reductase (Old Yellow Enzyme family)
MTATDFPLLFSPFPLGHAEAPNRIVSTSHGTNMAVDDAPGLHLIRDAIAPRTLRLAMRDGAQVDRAL